MDRVFEFLAGSHAGDRLKQEVAELKEKLKQAEELKLHSEAALLEMTNQNDELRAKLDETKAQLQDILKFSSLQQEVAEFQAKVKQAEELKFHSEDVMKQFKNEYDKLRVKLIESEAQRQHIQQQFNDTKELLQSFQSTVDKQSPPEIPARNAPSPGTFAGRKHQIPRVSSEEPLPKHSEGRRVSSR